MDFEIFRPVLAKALRRGDPSKGGRPGFDVVLKFKMLVLQALYGLSLEQTEYMVRDRLSWMRFCGLGLSDRVPDANTLWDFREALIRAKALDRLFIRLDRAIGDAGYMAVGGQIVDGEAQAPLVRVPGRALVAAPKQRNRDDEKADIKAGRVPKAWKDKPAKLRQKDVDARWTVKFARARERADCKPQPDIAIPVYGCKSHISVDRRHRIIRRQIATDAAAHDGARLREGLVDPNNFASDVWADTAYRSKQNEAWLARLGETSRIRHKKPPGKPMARLIARGNAMRSKVRAHVEHVFAEQKARMGLFVRTIGLHRAEATITPANMAYNMRRWCWLERQAASA